ncbi:hypothetical protein L4O28_005538, partial [Pseudomonas aeruginosa]
DHQSYITSTHTNCLIRLVKEQLVKAFVSTEAAHSTATSLSVKRYFRKFSFLLNRLRRPSNYLPISGRRILQRSNSLSSTSVKLRFESLRDRTAAANNLQERFTTPRRESVNP